jgi:hypothetical protein
VFLLNDFLELLNDFLELLNDFLELLNDFLELWGAETLQKALAWGRRVGTHSSIAKLRKISELA